MAEAPARGLRLLSLDGGGIRGLSSLVILEELMNRIKAEKDLQEQPLPADYFDLIGGTSTGGLIAILLGRLRLSASDAITEYLELSQKVFSKTKWRVQDGMYKATNLENVVKEILTAVLGEGHEDARMYEDDVDTQCRAFVCAVAAVNINAAAGPTLFRSYTVNANASDNCKIWEAARATSAAPTFFKRVAIGPPGAKTDYLDAGLKYNNPVEVVIDEARCVFPLDRSVDCIVSIGTGQSAVTKYVKPQGYQKAIPIAIVDALKRIATDTNVTAGRVASRFERLPDTYFRLDVEQGLQNISLSEWELLGDVRQYTRDYLKLAGVGARIAVLTGILSGSVAGHGCAIGSFDGSPTIAPQRYQNFPINVGHYVPRLSQQNKLSEWLIAKQLKTLVLSGMGGSGKSQLAMWCCRTAMEKLFHAVFWLDASSPSSLRASYKAIAAKLPGVPPDDADDHASVEIVRGIVQTWLRPWLFVLDNYDDPDSFRDPDIRSFIPDKGSNGRILITSRRSDLEYLGDQQNIEEGMTEDEGVWLLLHRDPAGLENSKRVEANKIVSLLGNLPLALDQAGAYIRKQKLQLGHFQEHYEHQKRQILEKVPVGWEYGRNNQGGTNRDYLSAFTTWELSLDTIEGDTGQKERITFFLAMASYLDTTKISERYFRAVVEIKFRDNIMAEPWMLPFWSENGWDRFLYRNLLSELQGRSLIRMPDEQPGETVFSLHPVIADWIKIRKSTFSPSDTIMQAILSLAAFSGTYGRRSREISDETRAHLTAVGPKSRSITSTPSEVDLKILRSLTSELEFSYVPQIGLGLFEIILRGEERIHGPEDEHTLETLINVGVEFGRVGSVEKGKQCLHRAIETCERKFGPVHALTVRAKLQLAKHQPPGVRETLLTDVQQQQEMMTGIRPLQLLGVQKDLAFLQFEPGHFEQAKASYEQILESLMRPDPTLDVDYGQHLFLALLYMLAIIYVNLARWTESVELCSQLIPMYGAILGPQDFFVSGLSNLAVHPRQKRMEQTLARATWSEEQVHEDEHKLRIFREWLAKTLAYARAQPWWTWPAHI